MAAKDKLEKIAKEINPSDLVITEDEVRAMLLAADFGTLAADSAAVAYFTGQINTAMLQASPALYEAVRAELTGTASEATLAAVRARASVRAKIWAGQMAQSEIAKMGDTIKLAIKEGWHPTQTARYLEQIKGLDSGRAGTLRNFMDALDARDPPLSKEKWERMLEKERKRLLNDRKVSIAQTEQSFAQGEGARVDALASGSQYKTWITAGDNRVSDACQNNEAEGWIPVDDTFDGGVMNEPQHVNCRCTVAYRKAEPNEAANARADARSAKTKAAKKEGEE